MATEPAAVREIVSRCARLPLALTMVAARVRSALTTLATNGHVTAARQG